MLLVFTDGTFTTHSSIDYRYRWSTRRYARSQSSFQSAFIDNYQNKILFFFLLLLRNTNSKLIYKLWRYWSKYYKVIENIWILFNWHSKHLSIWWHTIQTTMKVIKFSFFFLARLFFLLLEQSNLSNNIAVQLTGKSIIIESIINNKHLLLFFLRHNFRIIHQNGRTRTCSYRSNRGDFFTHISGSQFWIMFFFLGD